MLYILDRILFLNIINKYKYTFTLYYYINYYIYYYIDNMTALASVIFLLPYVFNAIAILSCNELNKLNETNTYDYLEEVIEMDCSLK